MKSLKSKKTQNRSPNATTLYCPENKIIYSPKVGMKTIINHPLIVQFT